MNFGGGRRPYCSSGEFARCTSQVRAQVKFESGSVSSVFFFISFVFVFIKGCDCDSCFHNNYDVPTDVRSFKHEREVIQEHCQHDHENECSVAN